MSWSGAQLKIDEGSEADPGSSDALSLPIVETPETITFSIVFTGAEISTGSRFDIFLDIMCVIDHIRSDVICVTVKKQLDDDTPFLYPATQKVAGYYVIPSENFELLSVCPSVRPSALRFRTLT